MVLLVLLGIRARNCVRLNKERGVEGRVVHVHLVVSGRLDLRLTHRDVVPIFRNFCARFATWAGRINVHLVLVRYV